MSELQVVQDKDKRIRELEEQLIVAHCVIAYNRGGLPLAADTLREANRPDLLPLVKQTLKAERDLLFSK